MDFNANLASATEPEQKYWGKYPGFVLDEKVPDVEGGEYSGELWVKIPGIFAEIGGNPKPSQKQNKTQNQSKNNKPKELKHEPLVVLARPCFPPGFFFIPEPETAVWIEFVGGDLDCPVWTGVWYSPKGKNNKSPKNTQDKFPDKAQKIIRTVSGNVIELNDTKDGETVTIKNETHQNHVVMDKSGISIQDDKNKNSININSEGITIKAGNNKIVVSTSGITATDLSGGSHPILLQPLLNWLKMHNHTGNMGGPAPPFPADVASLESLNPTIVSGQ